MSLFKVRDWWTVKCGSEEEFDKGCLCVGNIDNEKDNADKIAVGSFSGILRIFKPHQDRYQAIDLLTEQQLDGPILQMELGKFIPGSQDNALAILMPRKLAVYSLLKDSSSRSSEDGANGSSESSGITGYSFTKLYDHDLARLSYNFTYGPFGGAYGKDYFCVQSFDGQFAFYEQDHFVFARFLSNSLLPGPLTYIKGTDSFVTFNSCMELESYKYQMLAASSGSNDKDNQSATGKKIQMDWSINIGEEVHDIKSARYGQYLSASQSEIVVLGERTIYCVKESGKISSQKRLDFFPSALCVSNQVYDKSISRNNLIIGTHNKTLMIYKDPKLVWAAGTNFVPIAIRVGTFGGIKGLIVMLDDQGNLSVSYLGTDAISNPVPTMESKEIDYAELEEEHRKLQSLIRQTQNAGKYEPTDKLLIRAQVPISVDQDSNPQKTDVTYRKKVTVKLYLGYTGENISLQNICLNINVQPPFYVSQSNIQIESLQGGSHRTPVIIPITIYGGSEVIPTTLRTEVIAIYNAPTGELRTTMCDFSLPMSLAGDVSVPKKVGTHKLTIETNRMPPPMHALFEDLIQNADSDKSLGAGNVITFKYCNGQDATILVSKTSGRYRIQSNDFEALWILTSELVRRIDTFFTSASHSEQSEEPYTIQFTENLPFHQYFAKIDDHFTQRSLLSGSLKKLEKMSHQFRSIQKRLLIRFKDRNPTPINNMDILFDQTYESLIKLSKQVEKCQQSLEIAKRNLSCSTSLMLLLLKLKLNLPEREMAVLRQYLSPDIVENGEQGWEEITEAGMTSLLRTVLSKSAKEGNYVPAPLELPKDTTKLKKHIALVYDRMSKGMSLIKNKEKKKKKKPSTSQQQQDI